MKKLAIMAALTIAAISASAAEVGIRGTYSSADNMADSVGVTVGQRFGVSVAELGFDRTTRGDMNVNKWSAVGSYDFAKYSGVTFSAKAGTYFIDPSVGETGAGLSVGLGASYPVAKKVAITGDYVYQYGASRVSFADGNYFTVGVKYSF